MAPEETPPGEQGGSNGTNDSTGGAAAGGSTNANGSPPDDDGLGEAGKRALDAERNSRRAAEKKARDLEAELTRFRESSMSEQEKAIEKAKREGRDEASSAFNRRLIQAEVRAVAAGKLADPEDAVRFLDLDDFKIGDDGEVDKKPIASALEKLVKDKPYLAASATRPTGDADQGARGPAAGSSMNDLIRGALRR